MLSVRLMFVFGRFDVRWLLLALRRGSRHPTSVGRRATTKPMLRAADQTQRKCAFGSLRLFMVAAIVRMVLGQLLGVYVLVQRYLALLDAFPPGAMFRLQAFVDAALCGQHVMLARA